MTAPTRDLKTAKVAVIINTSSGSVNASAEEEVRALLADAGIVSPEIFVGTSDTIDEAFAASSAYAPDLLIVLGGDGTIRAAAETCTSMGPFLMPLPGGTMNMLPKALYGTRSWQDALRDTLAAPSAKSLSGGRVGGHIFYIAAIAGAPVLWASAREALREGDISGMLDKGTVALQNMLASTIRYSFGGDALAEAEAVAVVCPLISEAMEEGEHALEAAAITVKNAGEVLALASSAAFGAWRDAENVAVTKSRRITIEADTTIPLILDGETVDIGSQLVIEFMPDAFKALVPA